DGGLAVADLVPDLGAGGLAPGGAGEAVASEGEDVAVGEGGVGGARAAARRVAEADAAVGGALAVVALAAGVDAVGRGDEGVGPDEGGEAGVGDGEAVDAGAVADGGGVEEV